MLRGANDHPLREVCFRWTDLIAKAKQVKERLFGATARECFQFYNGPHDFMYNPKSAAGAMGMYVDGAKNQTIKTTFKVTTNKLAEVVQRFGPSMYFNNPNRTVEARSIDISPQSLSLLAMGAMNPFAQQQIMMGVQQQTGQSAVIRQAKAELISALLNYTPNELALQNESRQAIVEALIKGMGCLWTQVKLNPTTGQRMIGSFYESVDRLIIDPDAESLKTAKWIALECTHPVWEVEDEYGQPRGTLKADRESANMAGMVEAHKEYNRERFEGKTNDLITYYKIWSRMGIGGRLKGSDEGMQETLDQLFGDNVFLVVSKGVPYPINMPAETLEADTTDPMQMQEALSGLQWPIPLWADDRWPVQTLGFHFVPGSPWPMSHLKPGLGELRFINWCMSFLADKVYLTSRDFIAIADSAEKELETAIQKGDSLTIIRFKNQLNKKISELVQFLQHPPMNRDVMDVLNLVMQMFDKRVGLSELLYGMTANQMRSAEEAQVKSQMSTIVIDDMSNRTSQWQTDVARAEGLTWQWLGRPDDVAQIFSEQYSAGQPPDPMNPMGVQPVMGPITSLWAQLCYRPPTDPAGIASICRELDYRIDADSLRMPGTSKNLENIDQFVQSPMAQMMQSLYQMSGNPAQLNALLVQWCKARQMDPTPFLFPDLQMQMQAQAQAQAAAAQQQGPPQ